MDKQTQAVIKIDQSITSPQLKRITKPNKLNPQKVKALAMAGVSNADIAQHQDVNPSTIWRFLKRSNIEAKDINYYTAHRSEILKIIQCNDLELHNRLVKSYLDRNKESINAMGDQAKIGLINVLNNSFGTKYDKERLEEGKSTSIVFYADLIKAKQIVDQEIQEAEVVDNMSSNEGKTGI